MQLAQRAGEVRVQPGNERDPGGAGEPGRGDSGDRDGQHEGEGGDEPRESYFVRHTANRLRNALQSGDFGAGNGDQQGARASDVQDAGDHASPRDREWNGLARILYLIAHDGCQFEAYQREANDSKCGEQIEIERDAHVVQCEIQAKTAGHGNPEADEDERGDSGADATDIVDPLADA